MQQKMINWAIIDSRQRVIKMINKIPMHMIIIGGTVTVLSLLIISLLGGLTSQIITIQTPTSTNIIPAYASQAAAGSLARQQGGPASPTEKNVSNTSNVTNSSNISSISSSSSNGSSSNTSNNTISLPPVAKPLTKEEALKAEQQANIMLNAYYEKVQQQQQQEQERAAQAAAATAAAATAPPAAQEQANGGEEEEVEVEDEGGGTEQEEIVEEEDD